jgi:hypothetical protein
MHKTHIKLDKDNLSFHISKAPDLFEDWIKIRYPLATENRNLFSSVSREVSAFSFVKFLLLIQYLNRFEAY